MKLVTTAALAAAMTAGAAEAKTVALTAERLLDVTTGRYVERPMVVITDGRIVAVRRAGDAPPSGAERLDLPGVTLLPGLIDMHVHLSGSPLYGGYTACSSRTPSGR
jgi:imidazolonepropionase-like amidohydrolase